MKIVPFWHAIGLTALICAASDPIAPRQAADEFARDFKCGKDEVKVAGEKVPP
jgi:hypothetical protein